MQTSPRVVALGGLVALAVAMGIGRFAFTPILPMMQEDGTFDVRDGAWLASANYVGYLLGALVSMRGGVGQRFAIRFGLILIALATLGMAFPGNFVAWLALRALPGFASAWVLVYVSAWSLERLAKAGRTDLSGTVFAGVGMGIVFAGLVCLAISEARAGARDAWLALGLTATVAAVALWPILGSESKGGASVLARVSTEEIPEFWRLVFCYGAFGLGYIIPATFLPAMARQIVSDPLWFGWAWPVFGAAAVVSTLLTVPVTRYLSNRDVWILSYVVMAAGVLVPIAVPGIEGIVVAALCVGGTFMVNTMVGLQEAKRVAGSRARLLMGAMTSAFATGQIIGPLLVSSLAGVREGFTVALIAAALPLLCAACILFMRRKR